MTKVISLFPTKSVEMKVETEEDCYIWFLSKMQEHGFIRPELSLTTDFIEDTVMFTTATELAYFRALALTLRNEISPESGLALIVRLIKDYEHDGLIELAPDPLVVMEFWVTFLGFMSNVS